MTQLVLPYLNWLHCKVHKRPQFKAWNFKQLVFNFFKNPLKKAYEELNLRFNKKHEIIQFIKKKLKIIWNLDDFKCLSKNEIHDFSAPTTSLKDPLERP